MNSVLAMKVKWWMDTSAFYSIFCILLNLIWRFHFPDSATDVLQTNKNNLLTVSEEASETSSFEFDFRVNVRVLVRVENGTRTRTRNSTLSFFLSLFTQQSNRYKNVHTEYKSGQDRKAARVALITAGTR